MNPSAKRGNNPERWDCLLADLDDKLQLGLLEHLDDIRSPVAGYVGRCSCQYGSDRQDYPVFERLEVKLASSGFLALGPEPAKE